MRRTSPSTSGFLLLYSPLSSVGICTKVRTLLQNYYLLTCYSKRLKNKYNHNKNFHINIFQCLHIYLYSDKLIILFNVYVYLTIKESVLKLPVYFELYTRGAPVTRMMEIHIVRDVDRRPWGRHMHPSSAFIDVIVLAVSVRAFVLTVDLYDRFMTRGVGGGGGVRLDSVDFVDICGQNGRQ